MQIKSLSPLSGIDTEVNIPGSKYLANRVVMVAGLADGNSSIKNVPINDDIDTALAEWQKLGADVVREGTNCSIRGVAGKPRLVDNESIFTSASGTFSRFMSACLALSETPIDISGDAKMNTRPMGDLFAALKDLGASVNSPNSRLPATIAGPLLGGKVAIAGDVSSQFISALLIVAPYMQKPLELSIKGELVSAPYVDMTIDIMKHFGVSVEKQGEAFVVPLGQGYIGKSLTLDADPVSTSYFLAAAALSGGRVKIKDYNFASKQGEAQFPYLLEKMGCRLHFDAGTLELSAPTDGLKGIEVDLGAMPDVGQTLAVLAACAEGETRILNVGHLRFKESDRINDTITELKKLGVEASCDETSMTIRGGQLRPADIETYDDHRMAMSFALLGLKQAGVRILHADVVSKSFPTYWDLMAQCGIQVNEH